MGGFSSFSLIYVRIAACGDHITPIGGCLLFLDEYILYINGHAALEMPAPEEYGEVLR